MVSKTYHILDLNDVLKVAAQNRFHAAEGAHWENLPNGKVFLVANFPDEGAEEHFLKETAGSRTSLPHPVYGASEPISEEHAKHLHDHPFTVPEHDKAEHKLAKAKTLTVHDIAKRFGAKMPKFKLHNY